MSTETLVLDAQLDTAGLFGQYDAHLRAIEESLQVSVRARGQQLVIEGSPEAIANAKQVLDELSRLQTDGTPVGPEDVRYLLSKLEQSASPTLPEPKLYGLATRVAPRTATQAAYLHATGQHDLVLAVGPAGTGKTYLAMAAAVSAYNQKQVRRIVLTRPAVEAGERLGFLPGDLIEKVNPYLRPLYDALYELMTPEKAERLLAQGTVEIAPLAFMRGRTLDDAFIILDEAQNTTADQMKMFLTRLGEHSQVVVTGDPTQVDLPSGETSGLADVVTLLKGVEGVSIIRFSDQDVVRHPLVARIVRAYTARDQDGSGNGSRGATR